MNISKLLLGMTTLMALTYSHPFAFAQEGDCEELLSPGKIVSLADFKKAQQAREEFRRLADPRGNFFMNKTQSRDPLHAKEIIILIRQQKDEELKAFGLLSLAKFISQHSVGSMRDYSEPGSLDLQAIHELYKHYSENLDSAFIQEAALTGIELILASEGADGRPRLDLLSDFYRSINIPEDVRMLSVQSLVEATKHTIDGESIREKLRELVHRNPREVLLKEGIAQMLGFESYPQLALLEKNVKESLQALEDGAFVDKAGYNRLAAPATTSVRSSLLSPFQKLVSENLSRQQIIALIDGLGSALNAPKQPEPMRTQIVALLDQLSDRFGAVAGHRVFTRLLRSLVHTKSGSPFFFARLERALEKLVPMHGDFNQMSLILSAPAASLNLQLSALQRMKQVQLVEEAPNMQQKAIVWKALTKLLSQPQLSLRHRNELEAFLNEFAFGPK